jgi:hypothetical protein
VSGGASQASQRVCLRRASGGPGIRGFGLRKLRTPKGGVRRLRSGGDSSLRLFGVEYKNLSITLTQPHEAIRDQRLLVEFNGAENGSVMLLVGRGVAKRLLVL